MSLSVALVSTSVRVERARISRTLFWTQEVHFALFSTSTVLARVARYCAYELQTYLEEGGGGDFFCAITGASG